MNLAKRITNVSPSVTLQITSLAKQLLEEGKDVVNFAAGEPDFDTPDFIKEKAISAIQQGFTKYTPSQGIASLRESICRKLSKENNLQYQPDQILVSSGAKHCIYNIIQVLIDKGKQVIIPSPYWVSYPEMVKLAGGKIKFLKTKANNKFKIDISRLQRLATNKTKLLILNSPSNPTGSVYNRDELEKIAEICIKFKISVISDEIYEKIIYDGKPHVSIGSLNKDIYDLTFTVNGVSKSFSMTGWRIGYLAASKEAVANIKKLQDHSTSCANSISQKAAQAALNSNNNFIGDMRNVFQQRRDYIMKRLDRIKKINYIVPEGAFYIFCKISNTGLDSLEFSKRLLNQMKVAVIPGIGFGEDRYIRISFAKDIKEIEKGMDRLEQWVKQLQKKS